MDHYGHVAHEAEQALDLTARAMALVGTHRAEVRRVLDVGCGPGVGTRQLVEQFPGAHVVAADASPAMLERVGAGIETRLVTLPAGLEDLEPVDVVWASQVLHHVEDLPAALAALRRVLVPGGVLAVVEQPAHPVDVAAIDAAGFAIVADEQLERPGAVRRVVVARR